MCRKQVPLGDRWRFTAVASLAEQPERQQRSLYGWRRRYAATQRAGRQRREAKAINNWFLLPYKAFHVWLLTRDFFTTVFKLPDPPKVRLMVPPYRSWTSQQDTWDSALWLRLPYSQNPKSWRRKVTLPPRLLPRGSGQYQFHFICLLLLTSWLIAKLSILSSILFSFFHWMRWKILFTDFCCEIYWQMRWVNNEMIS